MTARPGVEVGVSAFRAARSCSLLSCPLLPRGEKRARNTSDDGFEARVQKRESLAPSAFQPGSFASSNPRNSCNIRTSRTATCT